MRVSYISCMFEVREGKVWVSTSGSLDRASDTDVVRVVTPFTKDCMTLSPGADGEILVGGRCVGFQAGVPRFRRAGAVDMQWPGSTAHSSYQATYGSNWFATIGTLHQVAGDIPRVWSLPPELATLPPQAVVQHAAGALWILIGNMGLHKHSNASWSEFKLAGMPPGTVIAVNRDADGRLRFGYPSGAAVVQGEVLRSFAKEDGLDNGPETAIRSAGEHAGGAAPDPPDSFAGPDW